MTDARKPLHLAALVVGSLLLAVSPAKPQTDPGQTCGERLTEQLRRFSQECVAEVVSFVASQPKMAARIASDKDKYYVTLTQSEDGLLAEAVSKFNFPLVKDETPETLKRLGWMAPENESDNWKKKLGGDAVKTGGAAEDISKALAAYGLQSGEAISLTVGPEVAK